MAFEGGEVGSQKDDRAFTTDLAAGRGGDWDAVERLLEAAAPSIREAIEIGPTWQGMIDADDVMQVTYMEAFTRFGQFAGNNQRSFSVWLRQIAKNNLRDAIRSLEREKRPSPRRRVQAQSEDSCVDLCTMMGVTSKTPSSVVSAEEARSLIDQALSRMPERYAKALRLFDLEGLTGPEVAEQLGCSRVTAFMLRSRARDLLRELLGSTSNYFSRKA
ncbi:MAG: sigma-70 family RNA polymerase sigma factor [Phycisphaerales bacterium]|nr:sigma-70 family RNA polymerase sigma factor [Phycisphaerales bacterium]